MQGFTHKEAQVEAVQLSKETQGDVVIALGDECSNGLMSQFSVEVQADGTFKFSFRYKTDTVPTTLVAGDYLVKLSSGSYVGMSAETFESQYGV